MARRATFIKEHLASNPNSIIVDSGNNAHNPQQAEVFFDAMKLMGYAAVGVGDQEARIADYYYAAATEAGMTVVAPEIDGVDVVVPYMVSNVGGVKVGIVAFNVLRAENDTLETARKRIAAYSAARKASDVLVVLDQGHVVNDQWLEGMGKRLGVPDIVIPGYLRSSQTEARTVGRTSFSPPSSLGYHVGVFTVEIHPGQEPKIAFSRTELTEDIADDPEMAEIVDEYMKRQQQRIPQEPPTELPPLPVQPPPQVEPPTPEPPVFREEAHHNPDSCKSCHQSQYDSWAKGKHAQALTPLMRDQRMVPECLKCHSEIFRQAGRLTTSGSLSNGVVCASCHSSVLPHGADYKATGNAVKDVNTCLSCHDINRSPKFDKDTYWPIAAHAQ